MHRKIFLMGLPVLASACVLFGPSAAAVDFATADKAVQASITLIPGNDICNDFRAQSIHVVDLDGDGVDEILFHLTARCNGANFDCPNALVVLTALKPDDRRAISQNPGLSPQWDADLAAVRDSGYADDASVQIPGEVQWISISGNEVEVAFDMQEESPTCKRRYSTDKGYKATTHCPAPGHYVGTYAWTPGEFKSVRTPDVEEAHQDGVSRARFSSSTLTRSCPNRPTAWHSRPWQPQPRRARNPTVHQIAISDS